MELVKLLRIFAAESSTHVEQTKIAPWLGPSRHSPLGFRNIARGGERDQERRFRTVVLLSGRMAIHQCRGGAAHSSRWKWPWWKRDRRAGGHRAANGSALRSRRVLLHAGAVSSRSAADAGIPTPVYASRDLPRRHCGREQEQHWQQRKVVCRPDAGQAGRISGANGKRQDRL